MDGIGGKKVRELGIENFRIFFWNVYVSRLFLYIENILFENLLF